MCSLDFECASYQYASTSQPEMMIKPAVIVYIASEGDIIKLINYATKKEVALAVRTGGHSYTGSSSGAGDVIQLDMSGKRWDLSQGEYPYNFFRYANGLVTAGPAIPLVSFAHKMRDNGIFCAFGECPDVHLGGHCQTGN